MISEYGRYRVVVLGLLAWLAPAVAFAQLDYETVRRERRIEAVKTASPLTIDGALDEAAWREAPVAAGFLQNEPDEGEPATQQTEVRVVYDEQALYLDTFHDERNGYMFAINPMGAKWDAQMVNDGRDTNVNWDGLWSVQTRIVSDG